MQKIGQTNRAPARINLRIIRPALILTAPAADGRRRSMTAGEVRAIRRRLKLTQAQLASKIGVTRNTVARWEMGAVGVSGPVARLLRTLSERISDRKT